MIDRILNDLRNTWDLTTEQINDIEKHMIDLALSASVDSKVREELTARAEKLLDK